MAQGMWKKQCCLRMESLPDEVVECILERVGVKSLVRFKAVSKQWRSTIESRDFQERQLKQREQSGDPDVLMVSVYPGSDPDMESLTTLVLGSSSSSPVDIRNPWETTTYSNQKLLSIACHSSFDGLVCLYDSFRPAFMINPTTGWCRVLPLCQLQQLRNELGYDYYKLRHSISQLGLGKDRVTGTYKPVWLYNSKEIGLGDATTCEVFDFSINSWRYVTPSAPYRVAGFLDPVFVDGLLHWFTGCTEETKIVSFDLHTEAFQVFSKLPFDHAPFHEMVMCVLDNRLCVSLKKCSSQLIWSFNSPNKTWDKLCSIDLDAASLWFDIPTIVCALLPLALLDGEKEKKKSKLLFHDFVSHRALMTYDLETKSFNTVFSAPSIGYPVCYFQSLSSVL